MVIPDQVAEGRFADWLADEMKQRQMSQRMLAMRSGIDHSTIARLLAGDRQPLVSTLVALLRVLDPA